MNNEITTQEEYNTIIFKHIIPKIGDILLQKLTADDIQTYYTLKQTEPNGYKKNKQPYPPLSSNTVKKHHTLLKTSLGLAKKQKKIVFNPILDVVPPKYTRPETLYYDLDKLIDLFQIIYNTNLEPAIYLAGTIALRREEISGLRWDKVNLEDKKITIVDVDVRAFNQIQTKNTKNDTSTRLIAIPNELYEVLLRHKGKQIKDKEETGDAYNPIDINANYVVVNDLGYQINPATLSSSIMKLIKKNNLPHIHLRGLRHTVASVLNASGVTLYDISKLLGHASPDITGKIYTHTFQRDNQQTIDVMSNALSNAKKEDK
jgi:integrase